MFFRKKITRTGSALQLVDSYRDKENKPRQRIIISLGNTPLPKSLWKVVSKGVKNELLGIITFLPMDIEAKKWIKKIVKEIQRKGWEPPNKSFKEDKKEETFEINPSEISHHTTTELGPELVLLKAWKSLGMDAILRKLKFNERQIKYSGITIMNRLLDPCSENGLISWLNTTSFEDLFEFPFSRSSKDIFYRVADKLHKHKKIIEKELKEKEASLFNLEQTILLYDLTNTYFEGECHKNEKAKRGKSKENRTDAPLLAVGLVLDIQGFVIRHEVFSGNTHDGSTLISMIDSLDQNKNNSVRPMIIVDNGMASEKNLKKIKEHGYDYIVVGKRLSRISYEEEFLQLSFSDITSRENKPPVKVAFKDEENERIVFCQSEARGEKEKSILSQSEIRYLSDLVKLQKRIEKGRLRKTELIHQKIGRLAERHPKIARYYKVSFENDILKWHRFEEKFETSLKLCGGYCLRCSNKDMDDQTIWKTYMMLTQVESSFRILKSDLGLRPIYHQKEDRCDSHIFITILAYHLLLWIEHSLTMKGETRSWRSIRRLLQTHAYTTIVCPAKNGQTIHLRIPGSPDQDQSHIYDILDIDLKKLPRKKTIF